MKSVLRIAVLAFAGTVAVMAVHAAPPRPAVISAGTFTLSLDAGFAGKLKDQGVSIQYIGNEKPSKTSPEFQVQGGVVDLQNGTGEIQSDGGVRFSAGQYSVLLQRLALINSNADGAQLTALVTVDGVSIGRLPVFTITSGPALALPLRLGQISSGPLTFKINGAFAAKLSSYFMVPPETYNSMLGQFELNLLLAPQE